LKIIESTGRSSVNEPKYAEQNRTESKNAQSLQEAKKEAQGHMRILLAEDDDFLAGGIALALRNSRYSVDHVRLGTDADHALKYTDYDLLILDLGLPGMDGMEILVNLRSRGQSLPVLVLTARDSLQDRVEGLDSGANAYGPSAGLDSQRALGQHY
jgi:CheY-like chemotaxis protein